MALTRDQKNELYLEWLNLQAGIRINSRLGRALHGVQYRYFVQNDVNRAIEGKNLRRIYVELGGKPAWAYEDEPASVMEVLVAFAQRADDLATGMGIQPDARGWCSLFLYHLGLSGDCSTHDIQTKAQYWVNRQYTASGKGGLFPLDYPTRDQRRLELWYQLNDYLRENQGVDTDI